jgi:hypothetical protein
MYKNVALAIVAAVCTGCSSLPAASIESVPGYATLRLDPGSLASKHPAGLTGFEGSENFAPIPKLFVRPGKREIWYACPDVVATDWGSSLRYKFESGRSYELVCTASGEAFIRASPHGT